MTDPIRARLDGLHYWNEPTTVAALRAVLDELHAPQVGLHACVCCHNVRRVIAENLGIAE